MTERRGAAGRGVRRLIIIAIAALAPPAEAGAQTTCRPPRDLRVCQDRYGAAGRAFLLWTNGETTYTALRVYLDGRPAGEIPGNSLIAYFSDLSPGSHTFAVEGVCGAMTSTRASMSYTILSSTPHTRPFDSIDCSYDAAMRRLIVRLVLSNRPSLFTDVYVRRTGTGIFRYVKTVAGNSAVIAVDDSQATDQVRLQFFDAACYGSELIDCPGAPACLPPLAFRVCQDLYGAGARVFLAWARNTSNYTAFEVFLDGRKVGETGGGSGQFHIAPISPGAHTFAVRGLCGAASSEMLTRSFEVLGSSPHASPLRSLRCRFDPAAGTITGAWLPGAAPSEFIDVYVLDAGGQAFDYIGTIDGASTRVRVREVGPLDRLALQFFDSGCYGSPLVLCSGGDAGSGNFRRGDANGSGDVDLSDAVFTLGFLFLGDAEPVCLDAADANDDAVVDISDPVASLAWLFSGGPPPPPPGPLACGPDALTDPFPPCLNPTCP